MMKAADQMTKQELIDALTALGFPVDKTAKIEVLRAQFVANTQQDVSVTNRSVTPIAGDSRYVKHPNGRVFEVTEDLLRRGDMMPATEAEYLAQQAIG